MPLKIGQTYNPGFDGSVPPVVVIQSPETDQPWGGPYDPKHAQPGETAQPYPYELYDSEHGPYGPSTDILGMEICATAAGELRQDPTGDMQPITHAAPWPKGIPQAVTPDAQAPAMIERADIHASDMGASRRVQFEMPAQNDKWTSFDFTDAGDSIQETVPGQIKSAGHSFGSTDRVTSYARQNQYGFDSAHRSRRWATGSIPGNYDMLRPGSRPMVIRPQRSFNPVGKDSPFEGQDPGANFETQGAILTDIPAEYAPPPEPSLAPAPLPDNSAPVDWY